MCVSWGGGGVLPYMHIGYVPHERPPLSALNFRSGAYNFHNWQNIPLRSITILQFLPFRRPSFSKFSKRYIAVYHQPWLAYCSQPERKAFGQRFGVNGQPDVSYSQFWSPAFFARARSGAPHFSLCHGTYLPKFGVSTPPPPPGVYHVALQMTGKG